MKREIKTGENANIEIFKCDMLDDFQTMCKHPIQLQIRHTYLIDYVFDVSIDITLTIFRALSFCQNKRCQNQAEHKEMFSLHLGLGSKNVLKKNLLRLRFITCFSPAYSTTSVKACWGIPHKEETQNHVMEFS